MATFTFPTSAELIEIAQEKMPRLVQDRPVFKIFPIRNVDSHELVWEQRDNYQGLQQVRGLEGAFSRVKKTGVKRYKMDPGVYGEYEPIEETELTVRRQIGTFGTPVAIDDLVMPIQDKLLLRRLDRIEYIIWVLLLTGTFAIADGTGIIKHTDSFTLQTYAALVPWSTYGTATPLADLRAVQLKHRGYSVSFGADAEMWVNLKTANNLLLNTNAADLYGRRTAGLGTFNNLEQINQLLAGENLPKIVIYDEGYISDGFDGNTAGTFVPFIADGSGVVIGKRPAGQTVGEYRMTRNANNPDMAPGPVMRVIDRGETVLPRSIEVYDGHNGGPALFFGSAIVKVTGL